jgi:hypothetical protein
MQLMDTKDSRLREMAALVLGLTLSDAAASADISTVEVIEKILEDPPADDARVPDGAGD